MRKSQLPVHALSKSDVIDKLESNADGISRDEVIHRLKIYGHNEMPETKRTSSFIIFVRQFKNAIVLLLLAAAIISVLFRDYTESIAILAVIIINAVIGYVLESQVMRSMEAQKS